MKNHEVLVAGLLSGVMGGAAMMAVLVIGATAQGISPVQPLAVIGETFVGSEALDSVAAKMAFGAVVHLVTSAAFGIVFAGMVSRDFPAACAMGLGAGASLFVMGFMMSVIVPWVNPGFRAAAHAIGGTWVVAHAVFGVTLATALPLRRWISRETSDAASPRPFIQAPAAPAAPTTPTT
jgi:hypothetical protein